MGNVNPASLSNIEYIGNPLADAQIALSMFPDYSFGTVIAQELAEWAQGLIPFPSECADFVCNGDIMFHTNKGLFGLRLDGIEDSTLSDVTVKNLVNRSPLVSNACGSYEGPHDGGSPGSEEKEGGMATDVRGIAITDGDINLIGSNNQIIRLESFYGDTIGLDLMGEALFEFDIGSNIYIRRIKSASKLKRSEYETLVDQNKTPYPNNFGLCTINIEDEAVVIGDIPEGKEVSDCINGTYKNKNRNGLVSDAFITPRFEDDNKINADYKVFKIAAWCIYAVFGLLLCLLITNIYVMCRNWTSKVKYVAVKQQSDTESEF